MSREKTYRYTSDAAGQIYRDGKLYLQLALSTRPDDRKPEAAFVAAALNAAHEHDQRQPGRRIFADGERHEFLRPADTPARGVDLAGRSRFVHQARDLPLEGC